MLATSPGAKPTSWPCGTAPGSARRTTGSPPSWPICAPRFGGPPTTATSTSPPPSPPTRRSSAFWVENYEPIAWAEELIEPARAVDHPRLALLYVMASQCYTTGRIEDGCPLQRRRPDGYRQWPRRGAVRHRGLCSAAAYIVHRPARTVRSSGAAPSSHAVATPTQSPGHSLVIALAVAGSGDEAMAAANGLIDAAEATDNPYALSFALLAYGYRLPRRRSRPRAGRPAPGPGDRSRQRQPRQRDHTWRPCCAALRPNTATRWPRSIPHSGDPQLSTTRATPP